LFRALIQYNYGTVFTTLLQLSDVNVPDSLMSGETVSLSCHYLSVNSMLQLTLKLKAGRHGEKTSLSGSRIGIFCRLQTEGRVA
jgi:hypothetical protein